MRSLSLLLVALAVGGGVRFTASAFSAATANSDSSFATAASFCGTVTVPAAADTYSHGDAKTSNFGTESNIWARSGPEVSRAYVRFGLPQRGSCTVLSATLKLFTSSGATDGTPRTLLAFRAASSWGETTLTWNNQPATTGTSSSVVVLNGFFGWLSWDVTARVNDIYAGTAGDSSFVIRDSSETGGSQRYYSRFNSRENSTNRPVLEITFV